MTQKEHDEKARKVANLHDQMKKARTPYEEVWDEIIDFVNPRRKVKEDPHVQRGQKRGTLIFDSVGRRSLDIWINGLQGWMTSRATTWFRLETEKKEYNKVYEIRQWLQGVEEEFYAAFARSNFYDAIASMYSDGGSIATATWTLEYDEKGNKLFFRNHHPADVWIGTDERGLINTWFTRYWLELRELVPRYKDQLGKDYKTYENRMKEHPYEREEIVQMVRPRRDRNIFKIDSQNMPWESIHLLCKGQKILREGGYEMPRNVTWRTRVEPGEDYGRGPGWDALSDVKRVQQMARGRIKAAQFRSDPVIGKPLGTTLRVEPGEHFTFSRASMMPAALDLGGDYGITLEEEMQTRAQIEDLYHTNLFLLVSNMAEKEYTATQVDAMQGERAAVLGAQVGRIGSELLDPTFSVAFHLLREAGRIPDPPEQILEAGPIVPVYIGPMMQAQQRFYKTVGIQASLNQLLPLAEFAPQILDVVDWDKVAKTILEAGNMPQDTIRREREVQEMREAQAQRQQQMDNAELTKAGSEAYRNLNSRPESPAAVGIGEQLRRSLGG